MDSLHYLRGLDKIVLPSEFTYFNHCTNYLPSEIKQKMINGKYVNGWDFVPIDTFVIKREMSFVERTERVSNCLHYQKPLSEVPIIYKLNEYAKPFIIRVVMPKKSIITKDNFNDPYIQELHKIYLGLGDGRHEKLPNDTKLLVFATSQVDEISGKKVDIIYCVREIDLKWYASLVKETLTNRVPVEFMIDENLHRGSSLTFFNRDFLLERDVDFSRYIKDDDGMSEFERDYYDFFNQYIKKYSDGEKLRRMDYADYSLIYKTFENTYADKARKTK